MQAGKLLHRPHVPILEERNTRKGFFELEMLQGVLAHLPESLRPVIEFAYITGWRIPSEVLTLEWRQVDFNAAEVRLDPETTKNREGRVFPMTDDLRALLEARDVERQRRKLKGQIVSLVFFRMVATKRRGPKEPRPIRSFNKAWAAACLAAGCPGRIPHDLRRTAVRNMVRRGVAERFAMQLAGHKTRSVFDRYNIVSSGDRCDATTRTDRKPPTRERVVGLVQLPERVDGRFQSKSERGACLRSAAVGKRQAPRFGLGRRAVRALVECSFRVLDDHRLEVVQVLLRVPC